MANYIIIEHQEIKPDSVYMHLICYNKTYAYPQGERESIYCNITSLMDECITKAVDRGEYTIYCKDMQAILSKKNDRGLGIDYSCVRYLLVNNEKEMEKLIDDYLNGEISYEEIDEMSSSLESMEKLN